MKWSALPRADWAKAVASDSSAVSATARARLAWSNESLNSPSRVKNIDSVPSIPTWLRTLPRASAIARLRFKAARAAALLEGRDYVIPDDVKLLAPTVLRHRINVAPELELEGVTADQALKVILDKTEAPTA